jgi:integrase
MARRVLDTTLDTRTARSRLKSRGKPYWRQLEPGLSIGYRKPLNGPGKWVVRHYLGEGDRYETDTFGTADDLSDPDGVAVLSFWHAQAKAREQIVQRAHNGRVADAPRSVTDSVNSYIEFLESHRKSAKEARYAADAFILPILGKTRLNDLTTEQVRKWHVGLTKALPRVRTAKGAEQKFRQNHDDPERERRRKSTANRILTILKGALNRSWRDKHVGSDRAWRSVEAFKNVDSARIRYLSLEEAVRFINAADEDFRKLVRGALESGARYGELRDMLVTDFNSDAGTLSVPNPKTGRPRHIVLSDAGMEFFDEITADRTGSEPIFLKADGSKWLDDHQSDPIRETNKAAKISPPINFHGLRHTWASHAVMNGMPLLVVAKNLGHSTTRMVEKHYGHLAPSFISQAVRAHAPRFAAPGKSKVKQRRTKSRLNRPGIAGGTTS